MHNVRIETQSPFLQHQFASISHIPQEKRWASRLFLLLLGWTLDLCRTPESLLSVLALLAYISILSAFHQIYTVPFISKPRI